MKQLSALKAILTGAMMCGSLIIYAKHDPVNSDAYAKNISQAPLLFTENKGQVADSKGKLRPDVLFTAHSGGTKVFLTANGIHYQFIKTDYPAGYVKDERRVTHHKLQDALRKQVKTSTHHFSLVLDGANPDPIVRKEEQSSYTENFFLAQCPKGITGVHTYSRIVYENVYPGIDWVVYSKEQGMKYDFIVHAGADPSQIKLKINDADAVSITKEGSLQMTTSLGKVTEDAPVSYCGTQQVNTNFMQQLGKISFVLGNYDHNQTLTIDPSVSWATYYGGSGDDIALACSADGNGNVYILGSTNSTSGIASGGFKDTLSGSGYDVLLVKFNNLGIRQWATYYGGNADDEGVASAIDGNGNIYIAGVTASSTGIALNGYKDTEAVIGIFATDAFLAKFDDNGSLQWATYYGDKYYDYGFGCSVDNNNNVYLSGQTESDTNIAYGGFQNTFGGFYDAFLAKFNEAGALQWATYYGGASNDQGNECFTDGSGNVYLSGNTSSPSGIASGGGQNTYGGGQSDAFLAKFNSSGARLWATYYGGDSTDYGYNGAIDGFGAIYLAGKTYSASGVASGGFQNNLADTADAFLVKFNIDGAREWGTYYGSGYNDVFGCVAYGDNIFVSGITDASSGIASGGFQNTYGGGGDIFVVSFSSSGSRQWASYFGGNGYEWGGNCTLDNAGNLYLSGQTNSTSGISTSGAFQDTLAGGNDAFLVKISGAFDAVNNITSQTIPIKVYPNPATDNFTTEADWDASCIGKSISIELINNTGQTVYATETKLTATHLSVTVPLAKTIVDGLYHVRVSCGGKQAVQQVEVLR